MEAAKQPPPADARVRQRRGRRGRDGADSLHATAHSTLCALLSSGEEFPVQQESDNTERDLAFLQFAKRRRFRTDPSDLLSEAGSMKRSVLLIAGHLQRATRSKEFICHLVNRFITSTKKVQAFFRAYRVRRRSEERKILSNWREAEASARRRIAKEIELRKVGKRSAQVEKDLLALLCLYHDCWATLDLKRAALTSIRERKLRQFQASFQRWRAFVQDAAAAMAETEEQMAVLASTPGGTDTLESVVAAVAARRVTAKCLTRWLEPVMVFSSARVGTRECVDACMQMLSESGEGAVQREHGRRNGPIPMRSPGAAGRRKDRLGKGVSAVRRWAVYYKCLLQFDSESANRLIGLFRPTQQAGRGGEGHVWRVRPLLLQPEIPPGVGAKVPVTRRNTVATTAARRRTSVHTAAQLCEPVRCETDSDRSDIEEHDQPPCLPGYSLPGNVFSGACGPIFCGAKARNAATPPPCPGRSHKRSSQTDRDRAFSALIDKLSVEVGGMRPVSYAESSVAAGQTGIEAWDDGCSDARLTPNPTEIAALSSKNARAPQRRPRSAPPRATGARRNRNPLLQRLPIREAALEATAAAAEAAAAAELDWPPARVPAILPVEHSECAAECAAAVAVPPAEGAAAVTGAAASDTTSARAAGPVVSLATTPTPAPSDLPQTSTNVRRGGPRVCLLRDLSGRSPAAAQTLSVTAKRCTLSHTPCLPPRVPGVPRTVGSLSALRYRQAQAAEQDRREVLRAAAVWVPVAHKPRKGEG
eukprot:TRINITY_DN5444_c0_g2_i3.p1 TRINITY_DN5444_c0_g2~~TRINITY_DN5444_c0_g2_i3.p1  ORF type:complete len:760 (+),score=150.11 TRINITY_DN5444_c0_g2_i3:42-2321(+)